MPLSNSAYYVCLSELEWLLKGMTVEEVAELIDITPEDRASLEAFVAAGGGAGGVQGDEGEEPVLVPSVSDAMEWRTAMREMLDERVGSIVVTPPKVVEPPEPAITLPGFALQMGTYRQYLPIDGRRSGGRVPAE